MQTFHRICIKDFKYGNEILLKRGREYLTSSDKEGQVTVFTKYWVKVPVEYFAGEIKFT